MDRVLVHDISHWQGNLQTYWQMFKDKGCKAIIIKATEGLAYYNIFKEHAEQAKEAGFLVGSYHYFRQQIKNTEGTWVNCDPVRQADNYFNWIQKCGVEMDLPPALDVEPGNNPFLSVGTIDKCLRHIELKFGRVPLVYSSPDVLINRLGTPAWGRYPLWLAHYTTEDKIMLPKAWDKWTLWQFSDKITYDKKNSAGTIVSRKPIDHNWFNGDLMDLYAFCGVGEIEPPVEPPVEPEPPIVISPADRYVRVKATWLRFRREPSLYAGDTLAVRRGVLLKVTGDKVKTDIEYWPVEMDGYSGFVSAGSRYTELA